MGVGQLIFIYIYFSFLDVVCSCRSFDILLLIVKQVGSIECKVGYNLNYIYTKFVLWRGAIGLSIKNMYGPIEIPRHDTCQLQKITCISNTTLFNRNWNINWQV